MAHIKFIGLLVTSLILFVGCGGSGDGDRNGPTAAGTVFCKSPIDGRPVTQTVAIQEAKKHNRAVLALGDTASVIQNVDCGDDVAVVPPVVVTP